MRILFVCENYFPHLGGAEVVFKNLAESYVKLGHQVTILTHLLPGTKKKETVNNVSLVRISSLNSRYLFTFLAVWKAISLARRHDLIQTTSFNGAPPAWLAGKITKKPVVITVHEVWCGKWQVITGFSWIKSTIHELLERIIYLLSYDKYICVSNATREDLIKIKIPEKKVSVIYNGLDYEFWNKTKVIRKNFKKELGFDKNYVFFSWGRPGPTKGFNYLVKAFQRVSEKSPQAILLLMLGKVKMHEPRRLELINLVKQFNLQEKIKIINPCSDEELREFISMADCVIIPSTSEGFGYTTVESSALGTPVVVSNAGSIPEVVSGRHLIFKNRNIQDLASKAINAVQGRFKFKEPKTFSWSESVDKYLEVYSQCLKTK